MVADPTDRPANPPGLLPRWTGRGEAVVLGVVAGGLFLAEGFYLLSNPLPLLFGSVSTPAAGAVSAAAGLAVFFLATFYRMYAFQRSYLGTLVVLVSAGALWFGGGFWVGSFLGAVAGALMILLPPYARYYRPEWPPQPV